MPAITPIPTLRGNVSGTAPEPDQSSDDKGFKDLLEGHLSRSELEDIVSRLESLGDEVDPALLEMLKQAMADGNELPFAAIALPVDLMAEGVEGEATDTAELAVIDGQAGKRPATKEPRFVTTSAVDRTAASPALAATASVVAAAVKPEPAANFQADLGAGAIDLRSTGLQATPPRALAEGVGMAAARITQVAPRVGEAGWHQAVADRVMMMVGREQQTVELRLNPAHLGPMEVKLSLNHDQASVSFIANHAAVRDALEQAIPRLRDMLGQQDIQLVQADVGQHQPDTGPHGQQGAGTDRSPQGNGLSADEAAAEHELSSAGGMVKRGLVDAYV